MDTVDVLIYVHPELPADARSTVEREVLACAGVLSADFDHHKHPHALTVLYNPEAVKDQKILETVRRHDPAATMVGL
jgi:hypothetical protein